MVIFWSLFAWTCCTETFQKQEVWVCLLGFRSLSFCNPRKSGKACEPMIAMKHLSSQFLNGSFHASTKTAQLLRWEWDQTSFRSQALNQFFSMGFCGDDFLFLYLKHLRWAMPVLVPIASLLVVEHDLYIFWSLKPSFRHQKNFPLFVARACCNHGNLRVGLT